MEFPFLPSRGVLGLNARNLLYVRAYNPKKVTAFADDKLKTKMFLSTRGIPVPKMYAAISTRDQLRAFDFSILPDSVALKPNFGFGGEGIRILKGRKKGQFLEKGKIPVSNQELFEHIEDILDGKFSLNGRKDTAFFEQLLIPHECFSPFRPAGLPDLRIVVFNLVPVMAMLRIPTAQSGGKANLHLGGIGMGIDLAKGTTTYAAQSNKMISVLPHGGDPRGIKIPHWDDILLMCSRIQQITNIGYLAVDITIDEESGPQLLEVNARAGLTVQIANLAPLRSRLERVQGLHVPSPEKGVLLGQELFSDTQKSKKPEQKTVPTVGLYDTITIPIEDGNIELSCTVSTRHDRTAFAPDLISELLGRDAIEVEDEGAQTYRVRFMLGGKKVQTIVVAKEMDDLDVRVSVGKRDLKGFFVDVSKGKEQVRSGKRSTVNADLFAADRQLAQIARELPFLKSLRPQDIEKHIAQLEKDQSYEPTFTYDPLPIDPAKIRDRIAEIRTDTSPFGMLLRKKKDELQLRLALLEARGDSKTFTAKSRELFGAPDLALLSSAKIILDAQETCLLPADKQKLSVEQVQKQFEKVLDGYSLHDWDVRVRDNMVADCAVGNHHVFLREGATFEQSHVDALIAHEIEAHVLTAENAAQQPYEILKIGCANYLDTQEGLAIYLQSQVLPKDHDKQFWSARGALGIAYALEHGFAETHRYLLELGYTPQKALRKAISLHRGMGDTSVPGAFTKDTVYFRGMEKITDFVEKGGDLRRLYVGRISLEDLELVEQLPKLRSPVVIPHSLRTST